MRLTRRRFVEGAALAGTRLLIPAALLAAPGSSEDVTVSNDASTVPGATGDRIAIYAASFYRAYESRLAARPDLSTWVQIDLGSPRVMDAIVLYPSNRLLFPGNGFPLRFRIESSNDGEFGKSSQILSWSETDYPSPEDQIVQFPMKGAHGRYLRLTATRLRKKMALDTSAISFPVNGNPEYLFSLAKISILADGRDIAEHCVVSVDPQLGNEPDARQLTRAPRPMGEGLITDNLSNVASSETWKPVAFQAQSPLKGVELNGGIFQRAMENNIGYLLDSFSTDDLLLPFRKRAGKVLPASSRKPHPFWEESLPGSNAGRFLMGASNTLRWIDHPELLARMNAVVDGIAGCRESNGYIMGYSEDTIFVSERGAYTRSWLTHGLIDAGYTGNPKAFELLRGYYDWYNQSTFRPQLLRRCGQGGQGMVANTRLYFTPVGRPDDLQVIQRYFQEDYWLGDLANRKPEAIWQYPYDHPHCYLLTNIEAYLDLYRATGDPKYLAAAEGGWDLYHDNWEAIGGSISIIELVNAPPKSHKLYDKLGENCGSAFWILLNQRFHKLRPGEEKYVSEIEKSIYNVILANQDGSRGVRYHTILLGQKEASTRINTCCEGQGTRILGSLPEYIYSIGADGLYVNLFEPSRIKWRHAGADVEMVLNTSFPRDGAVELKVGLPPPGQFSLHIRIPSWAATGVGVRVNGTLAATGKPGTYVALQRIWNSGDTVTFNLAPTVRMTRYSGMDQIAGRERYAVEYGPLLMAALGVADEEIALPTAERSSDMLRRLRQDKDIGSQFILDGLEGIFPQVRFTTYFEVQEQFFSCFPIIEPWVI